MPLLYCDKLYRSREQGSIYSYMRCFIDYVMKLNYIRTVPMCQGEVYTLHACPDDLFIQFVIVTSEY